MKIKRFYADTLRDALRQVKQELGSDAVILSNKKAESGIELVAAIDYDEKKTKQAKMSGSSSTSHNKSSNKYSNSPQADSIPETKNPDWLKELKKSVGETGEGFEKHMPSNDRQVDTRQAQVNDIDARLDNDIVSFAQAKQQRNNKKDPHISEARVNSVVDSSQVVDTPQKDTFSRLLDKQKILGEEKLAEQNNSTRSSQENDDIFNYDSHLNSHLNSDTYSKPRVKTNKRPTRKPLKGRAINSSTTTQPKVEWSQDPMLVSMKEELKSLKGLLQNQMSGLAWGNFNRNNPNRSELLQRFYKLGLKPSITETILRQLNETDSLEEAWKKALSLISRGVKVAEIDIINEGGIVALVGPTGVGKTTSIAKLASRFTLQHGASDIALVSTDSYRVGAQEQLKTYGQLLRVPVYIASDEEELSHILDRLKDKRLVLIDTAGMNQRDIRMTEQLSMLKSANKKIKLISVLSASAQSSAIYDVSTVLRPYKMDGCIVTKLDESTSLGGILSVIIEQQLPLQYTTDGQKVPEDIHPGRVSQLLKRAMGIVREQKNTYDYNDIALSFAGDLLQANG
jgi:flagellar biosynthesis protein FlhF